MYAQVYDARSKDIQSTFKQIASDILKNGKISSPRGKETKQCIGATVILNPQDTMIRNKQRKMNYVFSLVQKMVYTSGNGLYAGILDWYNSKYSYYEDGVDIGNYCWRIMPQLRRTVNLLHDDPDSRQAVISIYNNLFDQRVTKDTPCTLSLQFLIRDGQLDMIATMRSNDLLWGFSYDINQFSFIQKLIRMFLNVQVGVYIHHSNSLHIYDYSYPDFQRIINCQQYYTYTQQPDVVPSYYNIEQSNDKVSSFFADVQKFWKYETRSRFFPGFYNEQKNREQIKFVEPTGFFHFRLQKCKKYNQKKVKDVQHLKRYFK